MSENDELLDNVLTNEEIAKKLFEIETKILSIDNFKDLFEKLLFLIEQKFAIPHAWISVISGDNKFNLEEISKSSHLLKDRLNFAGRDAFMQLINGEQTPKLINDGLKPYYRLLPENHKYLFKSLAVIPLTFDGKIIGSLNMGDYSIFRFQPAMGIFFLSQLAVKISICISNVNAIENLAHFTIRDPVTHLLNSREMEYTLKSEFSRSMRYGTPLTLLFLHLDDLKIPSHKKGSQYENEIVKYAADNLLKIIRGEDVVFQISRNRFAIILPNQGSNHALKLSRRINAFFDEHPMKLDTSTFNLSIRFGVASTKDFKVKSSGDLLNKADERLNKIRTLKA